MGDSSFPNEATLEQRSGSCDPPTEPECVTESTTITAGYQGCSYNVSFDVTTCKYPTYTEVYFVEDEIQIGIVSPNGCFLTDPNAIENIYRNAVEKYLIIEVENDEITVPKCGRGSTLTSFHIKTSCAQKCIGLSPSPEIISLVWVNCSGSEACCIEERKWCINNDGELVSNTESVERVGDCSTPTQPPCIIQGYVSECISERCPF